MPKRPITRVRIEQLGLSRPATAFLKKRGIQFLDQLIPLVRITSLPKSTHVVHAELHNAMQAVLLSSIIDWECYHRLLAAERPAKIPLLPIGWRRTSSPTDFVESLPAAAADFVKIQFKTRIHAEILRSRILPLEPRATLAEIASKFKVSRARVHSIEERVVLILRRALMNEDYRRCHVRFYHGFNFPLHKMAERLTRWANVRARTRGNLRSTRVWTRLVNRTWNLARADLRECEGLILRLLEIGLWGEDEHAFDAVANSREAASPKETSVRDVDSQSPA